MPPPVPSESGDTEVGSDILSDSESVHTIDNGQAMPGVVDLGDLTSDSDHDLPVSRMTQPEATLRRPNGVRGTLLNKAKRKVKSESGDINGHVAKAPRTEPSKSIESANNEDDEDILAHGVYVTQSFSADSGRAVGRAPPGVMKARPNCESPSCLHLPQMLTMAVQPRSRSSRKCTPISPCSPNGQGISSRILPHCQRSGFLS